MTLRCSKASRGLVAALLLLLAGGPSLAEASAPPPTKPRPRKEDWWRQRHQRINAAVRRGAAKVDLLFIGDSITEGWQREGRAVWQQRYARRRALNLGIGGDETSQVLWRLARGNLAGISPKVAVLLVGVNNAFRQDHGARGIAEGIRSIVQSLRKRLPETKILLLGIFPAAAGPCPLRAKIAAINRRIAPLARDRMVRYLEIGKRFLGRRGQISRSVMFDYLHLTEKGYRIWAEAMEPTLRELLGEKR